MSIKAIRTEADYKAALARLRRLRIDVLHSPHFTAPIVTGSSRRVVTVHDLAAHRHPESHSFVKRWYFRSMIRAARREATSAEALADVLAATLLDDGLARSLRARARARARAFTWPRTAALTRDAYERAINVPGTNGG